MSGEDNGRRLETAVRSKLNESRELINSSRSNRTVLVLGFLGAFSVFIGSMAYCLRCRKSRRAGHESCKFRQMCQSHCHSIMENIRREFYLDVNYLKKFMEIFEKSMKDSLISNDGCLKMLPSYVKRLTINEKRQDILALDMGGTKIRMMMVRIEETGQIIHLDSRTFGVSRNLMLGSGKELFDYIAKCVKKFLRGKITEDLKVGFTFSFPITQDSISSAKLVEWTKEFSASGVIGMDIVKIFNEALSELDLPISVDAIINDTVGTLLSGAYETKSENCVIGLILGTGTNACYLESSQNVLKSRDLNSDKVIINIEWGDFDSPDGNNLPLTKYDRLLDKSSANQGKQIFEKMVSGVYMAEILRLIIKEWDDSTGILKIPETSELNLPYRFEARYMSEIEADSTEELDKVGAILREVGINESNRAIRSMIKELCSCISKRSITLVSAALCAIVNHMNRKEILTIVSIDGSIIHYTNYREGMERTIRSLGFNKLILVPISDGSGNGAALAAATVDK